MTVTPKAALDMVFTANDRDQKMTYRAYFNDLLTQVFSESESFSGKRPFGNSGWDFSLICGLVEIGAVAGDYDDGPDDEDEANKFVFKMIDALCEGPAK